ncbi:MAG: glycoside hydrolase family 16 [Cytophagaceae bacterium]|jgi:beta-glucanase (GH16 family)|nr:glycoside hydrolase family 16 [Cytophagaceae bacterium]
MSNHIIYRMRFYTFTLLLVSVVYHFKTFDASAQCRGNLVFYDEFNGTTLDGTKWNYDLGNGCPNLCGWGNNEKEYYTNSTQNVNVTGGYLNLTARYSPNHLNSGSDFTSGKIHTRNKFDRAYGRFEAKMKLPVGTGLWPAFWLLPTDNDYGNWPTSGEIDIMEYRGDRQNIADATVHYGSAWPNNQYDGDHYTLANGTFSGDFHEFAVEWAPGVMRFYVDNVLYKTETQTPNSLNPASNHAVNWPWDKRFYVIFNLALGGWFSGNPSTQDILNSTTFPQSVQVDYIRVYDMSPTVQSPYMGVVASIPGKVEAENYNESCNNGLAYNDVDAGNTGNSYRSDWVDIEACTDAGAGYNVGWTAAGEWLNYNVNVTTAGSYNIQARVASEPGGKQMHVELDGVNVSGTINVPATGGWATWQTITINNVNLTAGNKVMRIVFDTDGINCNYVNFVLNSNPAPTVSLTAPANGSTYLAPASVTISATASDNGSISKVEFYQGTTLLNSDDTAPYTYNWTGVAAGTYSITARAYDNFNLSTTSTAVSITVNNNQAPTVTLTSPTNGSTYIAPASVTISATANDTDGSISKVEFYQGTTLLNSDDTAPYTYNWTGVTAGTYSVTAKAYDNFNLVTTSTAVSITVNNNQAPTITLTAPINGAAYSAPAIVTISATANDTDGSISKVEFYEGTNLLNTVLFSPFTYDWTAVPSGTYFISAKAYDNLTGVTTSSTAQIELSVPTSIDDQQATQALVAYPNPFTGNTIIKFSINTPGSSSLVLYNELGVRVADLLNKELSPGTYTIDLNGQDLLPQVYTCVFMHNDQMQYYKIVKY